MSDTVSAGLRRAIKDAGSIRALARKLGISNVAVSKWTEVPVNRLPLVEEKTGISAIELRPDLAKLFGIKRFPRKLKSR
jgi:DNA-binding transcriptional regulator YdaS (Cro superfamily)